MTTSPPASAVGPLPRLAGQALTLVGLRWTIWRRRLVRERGLATLLVAVPAVVLGGGTSVLLAYGLAHLLGQLHTQPRTLAALGGATALGAALLAVGLLGRLYLAALAALVDVPFLEPRRFLTWAVPPWLITGLNLLAQLVEPGWLFFAPAAVALALGVSRLPGGPASWALLFSVALTFLACAALLQLVQAAVRAVMAQRKLRRLAFIGFLGLVLLASAGLFGLPEKEGPELLPVALWPTLARLPPGWALLLAQALTRGDLPGALASLAELLALGALALLLAHRLSLAEARRVDESAAPRGHGATPLGWQLPFLSGPVSALIEKEARSLWRAGWQQLVAAPFALLMLRLAMFHPGAPKLLGPQPLLVAAVYAHLGVLAYSVNAFGWDHDAVRGLFLWPVRGRTALAAKNAVAYFASLMLFLAQAALLRSLGPISLSQLGIGLLGHTATFPLLAGVGNTVSILWPAPMRSARLRRSVGATTGMLRLGALALLLLVGGAPWLLSLWTGLPLAVAYAGELVAMAVAYGGLLAFGEWLLDARREPMLRALARDE
jgi:hypothetical protein